MRAHIVVFHVMAIVLLVTRKGVKRYERVNLLTNVGSQTGEVMTAIPVRHTSNSCNRLLDSFGARASHFIINNFLRRTFQGTYFVRLFEESAGDVSYAWLYSALAERNRRSGKQFIPKLYVKLKSITPKQRRWSEDVS